MNLHDADIAARLKRFMDRKTPPRSLDGKDAAQADEVRALVAAVARNAPRDTSRLANWWPIFEGHLGEEVGRFWPDEKQIRNAAHRAIADAPRPAVMDNSGPDMSAAAIAARRMVRGEPVGEGWLYGIQACDLIRRHLVSRETMTAYRKAAFMNRREMYDHDAAVAWEIAAKDRHEAARRMAAERDDQMRVERFVGIPDKRAPMPAEVDGW